MTRRGWLLFAGISVFWGVPYLFIRVAVREVDPSVVVLARVGISAAVLLPVAWRSGALRAVRGRLRAIAGLSLLQVTGPFLLISIGEQRVASSMTSLLIASEPLLVATLALRLDPSQRVDGSRLAGLIVGMVGVVALLGVEAGGNPAQLAGAGLVILATGSYATSALLANRPTFAAVPSLGLVAVESLFSTVTIAPLAATRLPGRVPDAAVLASLVVLGLVCTAAAYLMFFGLIREVGASRASVATYVNPAVAVALGVAVLHEPCGGATVAGFLLIIAGSWFSTGGTLPPRLLGVPRARREALADNLGSRVAVRPAW